MIPYLCVKVFFILLLFNFNIVFGFHYGYREGNLQNLPALPDVGNLPQVSASPDTGTGGTEETTPIDMKLERTTLPESEVQDAMKLEVGTYTPFSVEFQYFNEQNSMKFTPKFSAPLDRCYFDFNRCTMSQSIPAPVCAVHDYKERFWNAYSYCDVYYDNCRQKNRHWRVVGIGYCEKGYGNDNYHLYNTRRATSKVLDFLKAIYSKLVK